MAGQNNTRPEVKSDERKRNKLNGLLCVDALREKSSFGSVLAQNRGCV